MKEIKCSCGALCWAAEDPEKGPCEGKMNVTEYYPGEYLHFCDKHGAIEDYYREEDE